MNVDLAVLRKEAAARTIHKADRLALWWLDPKFIEALEGVVGRDTTTELVRTDVQLYVAVGGRVIEERVSGKRIVA